MINLKCFIIFSAITTCITHNWLLVMFEHDIQNSSFISEAKYFLRCLLTISVTTAPREQSFSKLNFKIIIKYSKKLIMTSLSIK